MPLSRERRFIARSTTRSIGCAPSSRTSNRPHSRCPVPRASRTIRSQPEGSRVSAWRNSSTHPRAASAPAFICRARPRGASTTRSHRGRATRRVPSRLPPSATITSTSRPRSGLQRQERSRDRFRPRRAPGRRPRSSANSRLRGPARASRTRSAPHPHGWRRRGVGNRLRGVSSALRRNCSPAPRCSRNSDRGSLSAGPRRRSRRDRRHAFEAIRRAASAVRASD